MGAANIKKYGLRNSVPKPFFPPLSAVCGKHIVQRGVELAEVRARERIRGKRGKARLRIVR